MPIRNHRRDLSIPFLTGVFLLGLWVTEAYAPWIWTPQSRRWVNPKYAAKDTPSAQMDWAISFFEAGDYPRAVKEFLKLVRTFPRSELAPEAQYLAGVSYEQMDNLSEAFGAYKKLVEIYPFSPRFKEAIEREFAIAESFFSGTRLKLVGPISLPSLSKAIEIYQHIVGQAPYGEYGAKGQFRLGECYLKQGLTEEAHRAFQRVVQEYPSSPLVEEARFNAAFCARQLSLKPSYDQSATDEAIAWFEEFIATHPGSELIPEAQRSLDQLKEQKALALMEAARFYEIQGKPHSAVLYYRMVVDQYPHSSQVAQAVAKLSELERQGAVSR